MNFYINLLVRIVVSYFLLLAIIRLLGKKQIAQFSFFNYVSGIAIGSLTANVIFNFELPIYKGLFAVVLWGLTSWIIAFLSIKNLSLRKLFEGVPRYMIKDGHIMERNLRKEYLSVEDITSMLRRENNFSLDEVDSAIIEINGKLSIQSKSENQSVKRKDLNLANKRTEIILPLVIDGDIMKDNLVINQLSEEWLNNYIKSTGLDVKEILYMELGVDGKIKIEKKEGEI